jgi:hypothetical protein
VGYYCYAATLDGLSCPQILIVDLSGAGKLL